MKPAAEHLLVLDAGCGARAVGGVAARSVHDHEAPVVLPLRSPRRPRLPRLPERRDRVLVAVDVAGLLADDERDAHAVGRGRAGDRRGRRGTARVVGLERRRVALPGTVGAGAPGPRGDVVVGVGRRLVALLVAGAALTQPRLDLRAGEDRAADRMVSDGQARAVAVGQPRGQDVGSHAQAGQQPLELPVRAQSERARDVAGAERDAERATAWLPEAG